MANWHTCPCPNSDLSNRERGTLVLTSELRLLIVGVSGTSAHAQPRSSACDSSNNAALTTRQSRASRLSSSAVRSNNEPALELALGSHVAIGSGHISSLPSPHEPNMSASTAGRLSSSLPRPIHSHFLLLGPWLRPGN
jgi:hypothetical protein